MKQTLCLWLWSRCGTQEQFKHRLYCMWGLTCHTHCKSRALATCCHVHHLLVESRGTLQELSKTFLHYIIIFINSCVSKQQRFKTYIEKLTFFDFSCKVSLFPILVESCYGQLVLMCCYFFLSVWSAFTPPGLPTGSWGPSNC